MSRLSALCCKLLFNLIPHPTSSKQLSQGHLKCCLPDKTWLAIFFFTTSLTVFSVKVSTSVIIGSVDLPWCVLPSYYPETWYQFIFPKYPLRYLPSSLPALNIIIFNSSQYDRWKVVYLYYFTLYFSVPKVVLYFLSLYKWTFMINFKSSLVKFILT